MNDRGMIKWQPFNSVINSKEIINSLIKEKRRITKPTISDDDKLILENQIIDAYYMQCKLKITYYKNGYLYRKEGKIKKIDQIYKIVYLNEEKLLFNQIINVILD